MTTAIYPGRFDPVTLGHLDIIRRASKLFDRLIVSVFEAPDKSTLFNNQERQGLSGLNLFQTLKFIIVNSY